MIITTKQRSKLRAMANTLKPSVTVGKDGLTENVIKEIEAALYNRELVKVAALQNCDENAKEMLQSVCERLDCTPVQCLGKRFVVYKFSDKKEIVHIQF